MRIGRLAFGFNQVVEFNGKDDNDKGKRYVDFSFSVDRCYYGCLIFNFMGIYVTWLKGDCYPRQD